MHAIMGLTLAILALAAVDALAGTPGRRLTSDTCRSKPVTNCQTPSRTACGSTSPPSSACAPAGFWRYSTSRVWVPAQWVPSTSQYTGATQTWQPGRYETRRTRTWVATNPPPPRQYCRR